MKFSVDNIDFFGPLDLLLELIKAKKCDIKDIFITDIISQYLNIVMKLEKNDNDIASNFIIMASTLVEIKSRYLIYLDLENEDENPAKELFAIIEEYKKIKRIALKLADLYNMAPVFYTNKGIEVLIKDELDFSNKSIYDLRNTFIELNPIKEEERSKIISFKKASVEEKIKEIESWLVERDSVFFGKITENFDKDNTIASFLGLLELSKNQKIELEQSELFKEILIKRTKNELR